MDEYGEPIDQFVDNTDGELMDMLNDLALKMVVLYNLPMSFFGCEEMKRFVIMIQKLTSDYTPPPLSMISGPLLDIRYGHEVQWTKDVKFFTIVFDFVCMCLSVCNVFVVSLFRIYFDVFATRFSKFCFILFCGCSMCLQTHRCLKLELLFMLNWMQVMQKMVLLFEVVMYQYYVK